MLCVVQSQQQNFYLDSCEDVERGELFMVAILFLLDLVTGGMLVYDASE